MLFIFIENFAKVEEILINDKWNKISFNNAIGNFKNHDNVTKIIEKRKREEVNVIKENLDFIEKT